MMAGRVVLRVASAEEMWSRVEFANGDEVMVSIGDGKVGLFRMRGRLPTEILATLDPGAAATAWGIDHDQALRQGGATFLAMEILDRFTAKVLECSTAREVEHAFDDLAFNGV